jgi:hypothetical protein
MAATDGSSTTPTAAVGCKPGERPAKEELVGSARDTASVGSATGFIMQCAHSLTLLTQRSITRSNVHSLLTIESCRTSRNGINGMFFLDHKDTSAAESVSLKVQRGDLCMGPWAWGREHGVSIVQAMSDLHWCHRHSRVLLSR